MQMLMPIGDYWNDGHGKYEVFFIDAPDRNVFSNIEKKVQEKYGRFFFEGFANTPREPFLKKEVWDVLIELDYPVENLWKNLDVESLENITSLKEFIEKIENPVVTLDLVADAYIWILNKFGANITILDPIPIANCYSIGYGCFY